VGGACYIYTAACIVFRYVLILNLPLCFASRTPRKAGNLHFAGPGIFVLPAFRRKSRTYVWVWVCVCWGDVFMLAMKAFIFCVYSMANKCANAKATKEKKGSPNCEPGTGTLHFSKGKLV